MAELLVRMPANLHEALVARAEADDRSVAATIRVALRDYLQSGGVSSVAEAPPQGAMSRLQEAVAAAHDSGASAVTVDLPTGDDLLRLLAEAPPPQVLTDLEQQVVRSAADWLEQRGNYAAHPDLHAGMLALLMIIDRFCRHGAVRLDEGPAEATEGEALCGDPSCVCHEEGDDSDG